ncbi:MAG: VWA domain-containing protein [Phycisphaerales bacterium]
MRPILAAVLALGLAVPALGQLSDHPPIHPNLIMPQVLRRPARPQPVVLSAVHAGVQITDQVAITTLEMTLTNEGGTPQEAVVLLPVPNGASVRSLQYDGTGPEPNAELLPRDEARGIYESIVRSMRDPALVEFVGLSLIRTSAFPVPAGSSQKLRLTYEQVLARDGSRVDYDVPRSEAFAADAVAWSMDAEIRSKDPIATVYSSSHDIVTQRLAENHLRVRLTASPGADRGSLKLSYLAGPTSGAMSATVFAYPSADVAGGKGGYFLLLAAPPASLAESREKVRREVVIVLDRSGSMRGEKMKQAREAAIQVVRGLGDGEFFNIVDYSDSIASFAPAPVAKDASTAEKAEAYIARLEANGGTNIHDALAEALRVPATQGTLPLVLFLTDGLPTVGERNEVRIREAAKAMNKESRRIFTFGVGFDVNSPLLSNLATTSRAASTFILPQEDVEVKVSQVFRRLRGPVMTRPVFEVVSTDGRVRELQPAALADVFEGDQVVVLGQYESESPVRVRVKGMLGAREVSFETVIDPAQAIARNGFVPRLWATRKVAALVDEVRQAGAEGASQSDSRMKELVDEIVRLSTRFGVLTEYTAFLAREDTSLSPASRPELRAAVELNLRDRAQGARAGAGGVAQQADVASKQAASNAPAAGFYNVVVGREVRAVRESAVNQVADKTFFGRGNRWVDASILDSDDEKPDLTVDFGTDDYFRLAGELASEGRAAVLAQQGDVYLVHRAKRVLVRQAQ